MRGLSRVVLHHRAAALGLGVLAAPVLAQPPASLVDPGQKSVRMMRTDTPPVIDGVLDDAVWQRAARIDDLHQVNPLEYAEPSERTEIFILYDDDALYVGARLYMDDPDLITANVLRQNGANMTGDDTLFVTIDPFNTRRGGYFFGVNPNGVRLDGLYRNVSEYYSDWDSIWHAETGYFDGGWTVEYVIPFKSLSFDPNTDTWGLNFSRSIQARNEEIAWVTRNRRWDPSSAGLAVGFEGLEQGVGLDVVPSASWASRRAFAPSASDSDFEPSLDLVYKLTPQLNGSLTFNTDFSATEVDDRQVNLTRFNLFFPEKRDFFLREADIFEFGRIGAQDGSVGGGADRQNGRPFFSRNIGLGGAGQVVDLEHGGKVSGRVGRFELGALSIRQDQYAGVDAETLSVVRAKAGIGEESTVGMIYAEGDPHSNVDNSVAGADFLYRNSRLPGGRTVEALGWVQRSDTLGLDDNDGAWGLGFSMPSNAGVRAGAALKEFEENFNPALGFINRRGIRDASAQVAYTHRPSAGYWQSMFFSLEAKRIEELDGGLQSKSVSVTPFQLTNRTGDVLFARVNLDTEVLAAPFEIWPGVVIPVGEYSFENYGIEWQAASHRSWSGRVAYIDGTFYSGDQRRLFGSIVWAPSPRFRGSLGYNVTDVELPEGDFTTRLITSGIDVVFSSRLSWVNLIQYDNVSETLGVNMRLHWIPEAGKEVYFVINHTLEDFDRDNSFDSLFADATAKISYTFRF
ncbi:MAG TPA: carbohydrate binding family 9 domain-containing protein [Gammaproteobacteria bacterium]